MRVETTAAQQYLPVTDEAEVTFLVRLLPEGRKAAALCPLDIRFVLDHSGSMDEEAVSGMTMTKMEALKEAVKGSFDLLRPGQDKVCIVVYDDSSDVILDSVAVSDIGSLKRIIDGIVTGGSTHLSSSFRYVLEVDVSKDALTRAIIFTDGQVNYPSAASEERDCLNLARQANHARIPLAVFGTGVTYNEKFLRQIAELAGNGSYFEHISQVGMMRLRLQEDFENMRNVQDRDVRVQIQAEPSVNILAATKYVPQQLDLSIVGSSVEDVFPGLDPRGQAYLVRTHVASNNYAGTFRVATVTVRSDGPRGPQSVSVPIEVTFTDDESLISPVDKTIRNTMLRSEATRATLRGQLGRAQTLYETVGDKDMVDKLKTLAKEGDEDAKRTLRTIAATESGRTLTGDDKKQQKKGGN